MDLLRGSISNANRTKPPSIISTLKALGITCQINLRKSVRWWWWQKRTFEDLMLCRYYAVKFGSSSQGDFSRLVGSSFALQHCIRLLEPFWGYLTIKVCQRLRFASRTEKTLPCHVTLPAPWRPWAYLGSRTPWRVGRSVLSISRARLCFRVPGSRSLPGFSEPLGSLAFCSMQMVLGISRTIPGICQILDFLTRSSLLLDL
jgi:hypothetical protein